MALQKASQKKCTTCKKVKPLDAFPFIKSRNAFGSKCQECKSKKHADWRKTKSKEELSKYYAKNRELVIEKVQKYYLANKDKIKEYNRERYFKVKYNLSRADVARMAEKQNNKCAICKRHKDEQQNTKKYLVVDHCHKTGRVRELLCERCNTAIAILDNDDLFPLALDYIQKHKNVK